MTVDTPFRVKVMGRKVLEILSHEKVVNKLVGMLEPIQLQKLSTSSAQSLATASSSLLLIGLRDKSVWPLALFKVRVLEKRRF